MHLRPFTETDTYVEYVKRREFERETLEQVISQMAKLKRGTLTDFQKKAKIACKNRLKTVIRQIAQAADLSGFTWPELFHLLADVNGGIWRAEELRLLGENRASFEGRGEKSLRMRLGLPLEPTMDSCDIPGGQEAKYVGNGVDEFRIGKIGKKAYVNLFKEVVRAHKDDVMSSEDWESMSEGEVAQKQIYNKLPEVIRLKMQSDLAPEKILSCYTAMYLMSDIGYVRIPSTDFAQAFSLTHVTQMSPKYRLKREYVEARLRLSIPEQQPNVAA